jgi:hypothetical protein
MELLSLLLVFGYILYIGAALIEALAERFSRFCRYRRVRSKKYDELCKQILEGKVKLTYDEKRGWHWK